MMDLPMLSRRPSAEAYGTFCLVFAGTGAVVVNEVMGGGVTHVGVVLTFGLVVTALIYATGKDSGCHLESVLSLILTFVILSVSVGGSEGKLPGGIIVGGGIGWIYIVP